MDVIPHQAVREGVPRHLAADLCEPGEVEVPVGVVEEDRLLDGSPRPDVVDAAGEFDAWWSWHTPDSHASACFTPRKVKEGLALFNAALEAEGADEGVEAGGRGRELLGGGGDLLGGGGGLLGGGRDLLGGGGGLLGDRGDLADVGLDAAGAGGDALDGGGDVLDAGGDVDDGLLDVREGVAGLGDGPGARLGARGAAFDDVDHAGGLVLDLGDQLGDRARGGLGALGELANLLGDDGAAAGLPPGAGGRG